MLRTVTGDERHEGGRCHARGDARRSSKLLYATHAASLTRALHAAGYPDASDAVQEAFVQAVVHWRKISRYDDPLAWIRRVAINRGHNRHRSRQRQKALTQRIAATTSPETAASGRIATTSSRPWWPRSRPNSDSHSRSSTSPISRLPKWPTRWSSAKAP